MQPTYQPIPSERSVIEESYLLIDGFTEEEIIQMLSDETGIPVDEIYWVE